MLNYDHERRLEMRERILGLAYTEAGLQLLCEALDREEARCDTLKIECVYPDGTSEVLVSDGKSKEDVAERRKIIDFICALNKERHAREAAAKAA